MSRCLFILIGIFFLATLLGCRKEVDGCDEVSKVWLSFGSIWPGNFIVVSSPEWVDLLAKLRNSGTTIDSVEDDLRRGLYFRIGYVRYECSDGRDMMIEMMKAANVRDAFAFRIFDPTGHHPQKSLSLPFDKLEGHCRLDSLRPFLHKNRIQEGVNSCL